MPLEKLPVPTTTLEPGDKGEGFLAKVNAIFTTVKNAIIAFNNQIDAAQTATQKADEVHQALLNANITPVLQRLLMLTKAQPTLAMDFIRNEHYVYEKYGLTRKAITDVLTTVRASTAAYTSPFGVATAAVNEPRIEYNRFNGEALGLLCEEQRTNLLLQSDIGKIAITSPWLQSGSQTVSINQPSPDGQNNAVLFGDTDTTLISNLRQLISITSSTNTYQCSVYAKAGTTGKCYLRFALTGGSNVLVTTVFDFVTKTFSGLSGNTYQELPGGWFRLIVPITDNGTGNTAIDYRIGATDLNSSSTGTVFLFGAQLEAGAFPTSYIRTDASQVTRMLDSNSFAHSVLKTDFTIFIDARVLVNNSRFAWFSQNNTTTDRLTLHVSSTNQIGLFYGVGGIFTNISSAAGFITDLSKIKLAIRRVGLTVTLACNGVIIGSNTSANDWTTGINSFVLGREGSTLPVASTVRGCLVIPFPVSDAELITLTKL